ncbi:hypothetical protein HY496_02480 [Candidatus Woesearchaeota archaeon]|nr:hypothetical protein [Candidatus Woesearchaeota archaeon]
MQTEQLTIISSGINVNTVNLSALTVSGLLGPSGYKVEVTPEHEAMTSDHRLWVSMGRIPDPAFIHSVSPGITVASGALTENPILLITNPSTSTKNLYFLSRQFGLAYANCFSTMSMYFDPVVTQTGLPLDIVHARQQGATNSAMACNKQPMVSSLGNLYDTNVLFQGSSTTPLWDGGHVMLEPGHAMLVTANPTTANRAVYVTVKWFEL